MSDRPLLVVLGASGFVGSALVAELVRRDVRLRLVARRPAVVGSGHPAEIEIRTADLTVEGQVAEAIAGADAVINLLLYTGGDGTWRAAEDESPGERVNVGVVRDIVSALRAERRDGPPPVVLFPGSTSQVGPRTEARVDGTEPDAPVTAYDRQKLAAERELKAATEEGLLRGITLRLGTVFGGRVSPTATDRGVVTTMARRALAGEPLTVWNDGKAERDLLYVEDVAGAFLAALDHADSLAGRHWLVGTGGGRSVHDIFTTIAETVAARTGAPAVPVVSVPAPPDATGMDFHSVVADPVAFHAVTGWQARVPFREALERTVSSLIRGDEVPL
ncbi:NAD-dependent epimerase/dehydratase family protein [Streptosporangium amethystogenes subsp. fukuiense]|uniref:NAD-dependent epimerase/dehydratase family protein n=1 Tax=Streptosporangium amethystogenes subsp. fukuiense TaxID=698418 RepID=A0ABW2T1H8_9ACTN